MLMNCWQATHLLSEAQERNLTLKEQMALRLHLSICTGCRNFNKQIGTLRIITRAYAKGKTRLPIPRKNRTANR